MELEHHAIKTLLTLAQQLCKVVSMFDPENFDVEEARRVFEVSLPAITLLDHLQNKTS